MSPKLFRAAGAAACFACLTVAGQAAPAAVDLVFYAPFFSKVENGSTLTYRYVRVAKDAKLQPSFEDQVSLKVGPQGNEDSVSIEMFSGDRTLLMPNMSRSGNALIPALLEQDVRDINKFSGGSPYYLKNRFIEAIKAGSAEPTKVEFDGRTFDGWKVTLKPFAKDAHRESLKEFADSTYELTFADDLPGGLYAVKTMTPRDGADGPLLTEELVLTAHGEAGKTETAK